MLTKCDKTRIHEENSILSSIYVLLSTLDDIVSNRLNAKHDNGTRLRTCVITKRTLIKALVHHFRLQTGVKLT